MLYFVAAVALCVRVRGGGGGANLNTVKRIVTFTLESNLIYNLIYITIHLKKKKIFKCT